jgi:hypothetical protein
VSLSAMSPKFPGDAGIGTDASAAMSRGGGGSPRTRVEQLAADGPQRVRALERATRSANGSGCRSTEPTGESLARQSPYARRRRSEGRLQFAAGGPGPLTEDRQKTETKL